MNKKLLIILLFLNLFIFKLFSSPLLAKEAYDRIPDIVEAYDRIHKADEKLNAFKAEYNKLINHNTDYIDEYKDLLIEESYYERELITNQELEKELSLTHKAFETFLKHACKAVSLVQGGSRGNRSLCYAAARGMLIDSYLAHMQCWIFPQGWFAGSEWERISYEEGEKTDRSMPSVFFIPSKIEKEKSNLKKENNKKTSKFISFIKKLFVKRR